MQLRVRDRLQPAADARSQILGERAPAYNTSSPHMNEEYERLLSELTRRGFRFEFEPDSATASRVTSAGGNALDYPTPEELGQLVQGISIVSIMKARSTRK